MLNILIVDDIQENLDVLELLLEDSFDINLFSALSGNEALKIIMKYNIDIIITDLMMPNMDGLELTKILKQNPKTKHIPILIVTASGDETKEARFYKEGVFEYLTKPINQEKLINKISLLTNNILDIKYKDSLIDEQNRSKETTKEFINIFTHELKTPLNLIYNFSFVMKKRLLKNKVDKEKFIKYLTSIENSTENMLNIINNLLVIGRLEKGYKLDGFEIVDLIDLINKQIDNFETTLENKNINLKFYHDRKDMILNIDLNSIKGIVANVLSNAVKYGKDIIEITLKDNNSHIILKIEDNGDGIKDKEKIFEMFGIEYETKTQHSSGIGLYFVKLVCKELNIKYKVENSSLGGASFVFEFDKNNLKEEV